MKPSEALLKGIEMSPGGQCMGALFEYTSVGVKACALGALLMGYYGDVGWFTPNPIGAMNKAYGLAGEELAQELIRWNDDEKISREDAVARLQRVGL